MKRFWWYVWGEARHVGGIVWVYVCVCVCVCILLPRAKSVWIRFLQILLQAPGKLAFKLILQTPMAGIL